jgi:signal transduction histidine kinase
MKQTMSVGMRLVLVQLVVLGTTSLLFAGVAQRLLLLPPEAVSASLPSRMILFLALFTFATLAVVVRTRPMRSTLHALETGEGEVRPEHLASLYALPLHLTRNAFLLTIGLGVLWLFPPFRPPSNDLFVQAELTILMTMIGSVAALPMYVTLRASVTTLLERAPLAAAEEALAVSPTWVPPMARLRLRLTFAIVAPVVFVALGASLLVVATVRTEDAEAREEDARRLVRGVFGRYDADPVSRADAISVAATFGYQVDVVPDSRTLSSTRGDDGMTTLIVPLDGEHAIARFPTTGFGLRVGVYGVMVAFFAVVAAYLGGRLGSAYSDDVAVVTREIRALGVDQVLRGTRVHTETRFFVVDALLLAVDELGAIFRRFAGAQERAIEAMGQAERMRGRFLASMSHDLKAPLNSVLGFAEVVSKGRLAPQQRESVSIIAQRGRELLHLVETILDAARVEAGEMDAHSVTVSATEIFVGAVTEAQTLLAGGPVMLEAQPLVAPPLLKADPARATQALALVILTAARFADRNEVRVSAHRPTGAKTCAFTVEAPGGGVSQVDVDRMFDAFKDAEVARRHGSLGLGLSLARALVVLQRGTVVAQTREGGGLYFVVTLPVAAT